MNEDTKTNNKKEKIRAVLGIDIGTQGLTVILVNIDDPRLPVLAKGEGNYECIPHLAKGCYEQKTSDWDQALQHAMKESILPAMAQYDHPCQLVGIGIAGQMHGQVMVDTTKSSSSSSSSSSSIGTVRLWCDARNQEQAEELSTLWYGVPDNVPKRLTAARWLWTLQHQPELACRVDFLTTPAGWLAYRLTDQNYLGIGDASGLFPVDAQTQTYRQDLLELFDEKYSSSTSPAIPTLASILPKVATCGQPAGTLTLEAAEWLGLPLEAVGIPVAAAEGDQPAALVGSLIGEAGMVSCSFGTSVCANLVGSTTTTNGGTSSSPSNIQSPLINHFSAVNGQPIYMVWLRNGTTFFNTIIQSYLEPQQQHQAATSTTTTSTTSVLDFATLMPHVLQAPADCGGLIALPFMDDEPGLEIPTGGTSMIMGWNPTNATVGNVGKAALLATMFNLKLGMDYLQTKGVPMTEILLSGGLTKTPDFGQVVADVFDLPVRLLPGSEEGCAWGAAVLAYYRYHQQQHQDVSGGAALDWISFLKSITTVSMRSFQPNPHDSPAYQASYQRYQTLLKIQSDLQNAAAPAATDATM